MTDAFPPQPMQPDQIDLMLKVFATVTEGRHATYVSSPFTTGRHADEWLTKNGICVPEDALGSDHFKEQVLSANRQRAADVVRSLRMGRTEGSVVISPTALPDVPGWTQADYRYFWGRVIEEYAQRVVFLDGWQNSSGCAYEYVCAVRFSTATLDERLEPLPTRDALTLLHKAAGDSDAPANANFLAAAEAALRDLTNAAGRVGL